MPVKTVRLYTIALVLADTIAVLLAFTLAYILRVQLDDRPLINQIPAIDFFTTFLLLMPIWVVVFWSLGLYSSRVYQKRLTEHGKLLLGSFLGILIVIGYSFVIDTPIFPARLVAAYAAILVFLLLLLGRELMRFFRDLMFYIGRGVQRVLIIGNNDATADIIKNLGATTHTGFNVVAVAGKAPKSFAGVRFTTIDEAIEKLDELDIDTIIQTNLFDTAERNQAIMNAAQIRHVQYCFIPGESEFYSGKNDIDVFLGYPIISVYKTPLIGWGEVVKRIFDTVLVVVTMPAWLLVLGIIALLQLLFNPGPIIFSQIRATKHGKAFKMYKFRSMIPKYSGRDDIEVFRSLGREDLVAEFKQNFKVEKDPRISPFGNFLRKSSLDELPQLFNVLKGDLSLVGPRPLRLHEVKAKYSRIHGALLHEVRGGLTGLWQVSGRSDITDQQRVDLELYYVQNWSFWLDIKILLKTVLVVLNRSGAK